MTARLEDYTGASGKQSHPTALCPERPDNGLLDFAHSRALLIVPSAFCVSGL
jgi:hypothetical protein